MPFDTPLVHPIDQIYKTKEAVDEAYAAGQAAGCSTGCISGIFLVFIGILLLIAFLV